MPYVDRDGFGRIVGVYAIAQREGHEFVEQAEMYVAQLPLQERIDAFIRQASGDRIDNEMQLEASAASILALHLVLGGTEPQLEASNSAYRQAKQLRAAVAAMRAAG